jgi:ElaB/YqjD/DUF883 family membrane-anchored ribosome-binding protein
MATTKKATAKKASTAKKSTARSTSTRPAAKKSTKKATARKQAPKRTPLTEREPSVLLETAGYAAAGIAHDVVELAKGLPTRVGSLRNDAERAPETVRSLRTEVPARVESALTTLRERVAKDADRRLASFERQFDAKAAEGKKLVDDIAKDKRVSKVLDQTSNTRSQVKAAVTSVTKTADVAVDAASKAAGEQAKTARSQFKGAVTSARKTADVAVDAGTKAATEQAGNARSQVKAAATSVRKSADTIAEAATE